MALINPEKRFKQLTLLYRHKALLFNDALCETAFEEANTAVNDYVAALHGTYGLDRLAQYLPINRHVNRLRAIALVKVQNVENELEESLYLILKDPHHKDYKEAQRLRNRYFPISEDLFLPIMIVLSILAIPAFFVMPWWVPVLFVAGYLINHNAITKDFNDFERLSSKNSTFDEKLQQKFTFYASYLVRKKLYGDVWTREQRWENIDEWLTYFTNPVNWVLAAITMAEIGLLELADQDQKPKADTLGFRKDFKEYLMMGFAMLKALFHCLQPYGAVPYKAPKLLILDTPIIGAKAIYDLFSAHSEYTKVDGQEPDLTSSLKSNQRGTTPRIVQINLTDNQLQILLAEEKAKGSDDKTFHPAESKFQLVPPAKAKSTIGDEGADPYSAIPI